MRRIILSSWENLLPLRNYIKRNWFTFILYHRVNPISFEKHLEYYSSQYTLTKLDALHKHYETGAPLPRNALFITFDDGWRSNYDLLPIIEEKNVPVTIFLTTGLIGSNKLPAPIHYYYENTIEDVENIYPTECERTMLNIEEIRRMSKSVDFQAHGVNHHPSIFLTPEQLRSELTISKNSIENITGSQVYAFAYPYNRASYREAKIVKSCGFHLARIGGRMMNRQDADPFLLTSIGIEDNCPVDELRTSILNAELKTILYKN